MTKSDYIFNAYWIELVLKDLKNNLIWSNAQHTKMHKKLNLFWIFNVAQFMHIFISWLWLKWCKIFYSGSIVVQTKNLLSDVWLWKNKFIMHNLVKTLKYIFFFKYKISQSMKKLWYYFIDYWCCFFTLHYEFTFRHITTTTPSIR